MVRDEVEPGPTDDEPVVVPIEDVLDLHGFRPRDVLAVVDAYLDAAIERGLREVRLVHGRGKGVQRAQIRGMLRQDPRVLAWAEAPPARGGWGATLVRLEARADGRREAVPADTGRSAAGDGPEVTDERG